jgi:hypothetical protein
MRRSAEALRRVSHSASLQLRAVSARKESHHGRGRRSGSSLAGSGSRFQGQTSWQMSQPATQPLSLAAIAVGKCGSRFSIV